MPTSVLDFSFEKLYTFIVGAGLAIFFLASVIHQFRLPWWQRIASRDRLILLPRWTFFAPNPGRHDLHLVYRDWTNGQPGGWVELAIPEDNPRWRWIWHPSRFPSKGQSDLLNGLFQSIRTCRAEPELVMLSGAYISLLQWVMAQPGVTGEDSKRQFAIVATQGFSQDRSLQVRYISGMHRAQP